MSRRDLIDPESRSTLDALLEAIPGGFNAIPDITARRATVQQMLAAIEVPQNPNAKQVPFENSLTGEPNPPQCDKSLSGDANLSSKLSKEQLRAAIE